MDKKKTAVLPLVKQARETIAAYGMLAPGERVLAALSGGADSVALLLVLRELGYTVSACHLEHGLRGAEAERDAAFCQDLCDSLHIPLFVKHADTAAHAKETRQSIETAARALRYAFFAEVLAQTGIPKVATAHTASDNLETVLFHLVRGTGLDGLCGIPPVRDQIIRPLIACTRGAVEAELARRGQPFVTDSTNLSDHYTRNRLRHAVVPVLQSLSPHAEQAAAGLSARLRLDAAFLHEQAQALLNTAARGAGWDVQTLRQAHAAIRTRALRLLCVQSGLPLQNLTARHIQALGSLLESENPSAQIHLQGGLVVRREYTLLKIGGKAPDPETAGVHISVEVPFSGTLGAGFSTVRFYPAQKDQHFYKSFNTFYVDCDTIDLPTLVLRPRRAGDRIRLGGGSKILKKLLIDKKIPRARRDRLSILADCHGIIAVQDIGIDISRQPKSSNAYVIEIQG